MGAAAGPPPIMNAKWNYNQYARGREEILCFLFLNGRPPAAAESQFSEKRVVAIKVHETGGKVINTHIML